MNYTHYTANNERYPMEREKTRGEEGRRGGGKEGRRGGGEEGRTVGRQGIVMWGAHVSRLTSLALISIKVFG